MPPRGRRGSTGRCRCRGPTARCASARPRGRGVRAASPPGRTIAPPLGTNRHAAPGWRPARGGRPRPRTAARARSGGRSVRPAWCRRAPRTTPTPRRARAPAGRSSSSRRPCRASGRGGTRACRLRLRSSGSVRAAAANAARCSSISSGPMVSGCTAPSALASNERPRTAATFRVTCSCGRRASILATITPSTVDGTSDISRSVVRQRPSTTVIVPASSIASSSSSQKKG